MIPTRRQTLFYCLPIKTFTDEYMERMKEEEMEERVKGRVGGRKERIRRPSTYKSCLKYQQWKQYLWSMRKAVDWKLKGKPWCKAGEIEIEIAGEWDWGSYKSRSWGLFMSKRTVSRRRTWTKDSSVTKISYKYPLHLTLKIQA